MALGRRRSRGFAFVLALAAGGSPIFVSSVASPPASGGWTSPASVALSGVSSRFPRVRRPPRAPRRRRFAPSSPASASPVSPAATASTVSWAGAAAALRRWHLGDRDRRRVRLRLAGRRLAGGLLGLARRLFVLDVRALATATAAATAAAAALGGRVVALGVAAGAICRLRTCRFLGGALRRGGRCRRRAGAGAVVCPAGGVDPAPQLSSPLPARPPPWASAGCDCCGRGEPVCRPSRERCRRRWHETALRRRCRGGVSPAPTGTSGAVGSSNVAAGRGVAVARRRALRGRLSLCLRLSCLGRRRRRPLVPAPAAVAPAAARCAFPGCVRRIRCFWSAALGARRCRRLVAGRALLRCAHVLNSFRCPA